MRVTKGTRNARLVCARTEGPKDRMAGGQEDRRQNGRMAGGQEDRRTGGPKDRMAGGQEDRRQDVRGGGFMIYARC